MYNLLAIDSQWIMIILLVGIMVAFMVYSNHSQKKRQQETQNMLNAIQQGIITSSTKERLEELEKQKKEI